MLWFFVALLGYFFLAVVFILDKYILTESVSDPVVYTFYSTIFLFAAFLAWPFGVTMLPIFDLFVAALSGFSFGFALWTMYIAVNKGEASHINPFIGALITIFSFILAGIFLQENLSTLQISGIFLLVASSFLLAFEKTKVSSGVHIGYLWAAVSGLFMAISTVSAKYIFDLHPFISGIVWTKGMTGFVGIITLFFPAVWKTFKSKKNKKSFGKKHVFSLVVLDKFLGFLGVILVQFAIAIGSVTIINALAGSLYAMLFILVLLLTKFLPKIFNEYFTRKEIFVQTIAIILVIVGSVLFVL